MSELLPDELYTCAQVRTLEQAAIQAGTPGIVLMKRAGRAAFNEILHRWPKVDQLLVFCGAGNNGGDGYVVAALAAQKKLPVTVFLQCASSASASQVTHSQQASPANNNTDALSARDFALQEGVLIQTPPEAGTIKLTEHTVIVDALLGIGFHGALREPMRACTQLINQLARPVLALDLPSGLDGDSGWADPDAVVASATLTFVALKRGLFTGRAPALCGDILLDQLNIAQEIFQSQAAAARRVRHPVPLPRRQIDSHKGDHGHVMIIGGDLGTGGAALLAAEAALMSGAGLVSLVTRPEHVSAALSRIPEVMTLGINAGVELEKLLGRADVLVIGPGLGQSAWSEQLLYFALNAQARPTLLDADALNLIAKNKARYRQLPHCLMTPHPGEAARLLECPVEDIQRDRFAASKKLHDFYAATVLLKGAGTVIHSDLGSAVTNVGCAALATAAMGDVLSGVTGALLAQGLALHEAAIHAACAHGLAAEAAAENQAAERGIRATELLPLIRQQLNLASSHTG